MLKTKKDYLNDAADVLVSRKIHRFDRACLYSQLQSYSSLDDDYDNDDDEASLPLSRVHNYPKLSNQSIAFYRALI